MGVAVKAGAGPGNGGPGANGNGGAKKRGGGGGKGRKNKKKKKKDCKKKLGNKQKEKLRKASPGAKERLAAQRPPKKCPVCGHSDPPGFMAADGGLRPGQALEADHIVPFENIVKMKGFACLDEKKQKSVLNNPKNLAAMCKSCNSSKRERGVNYMLQKGGRQGVNYPKSGMDYLKQQQASMPNIAKSLGGQIGGFFR